MIKLKFATCVATAALSLTAIGASAQEATAPSETAVEAAPVVEIVEGATVTGNDEMAIGTVITVNENMAIIDTGTHQIPLPRGAFASNDSGLILNITKAELDSGFAEQMAAAGAALAAKLVAGAEVKTVDDQVLGTVDAVDGDNIVLALAGDNKLTLGKEIFAVDAEGGVIVRATMAQIEAAMAAG